MAKVRKYVGPLPDPVMRVQSRLQDVDATVQI
jgi:hypothetical protein